jgi:hypothetical protein
MKANSRQIRRALLVSVVLLLCCCVEAQTTDPQKPSPTEIGGAKDDKTGTNPLVLKTTVQIFNEYYNLPGEGLSNNITKFRFVVPFAKNRASIKVDLPFNATNTSVGFLSVELKGQ